MDGSEKAGFRDEVNANSKR